MIKRIRVKRERSRLTTIPLVLENTSKLYENDIISAFKIGKDMPRVSVSYGDELPLNQPSVRLEDIPTGSMAVDSPLAELQNSVEKQLETELHEKNADKKEEVPF